MVDKRWWEAYGLRYAVGSVIGAFVIYCGAIQYEMSNPFLKIFLPPKELSFVYLSFMGVCGLAYSYIASAPMLVLHATRRFIYRDIISIRDKRSFFIIVFIVIDLIISLYFGIDWWNSLLLFLVLFIPFGMLALMSLSFFYGNYINDFYKKLAIVRKENTDYVESYRHLREHANAFAVIVLEMAFISLLIVLYKAFNDIYSAFLCALFLWITPPATVWLIANDLEDDLAG